MTEIKSHQIQPHVYIVKQHRTVDDVMLERMLERRILPALEMFSDQPLIDVDLEMLLSRPEVMELSHMKVKQLEKSLDTLTELVGVDWIALPIRSRDQVLFAKVNKYKYIRYQAHLHIKHFIKFDESFNKSNSDIPTSILEEIYKAESLDTLSNEVYNFIQRNKPVVEAITTVANANAEEESEPTSLELEVIEMDQFKNDRYTKINEIETPKVIDDMLLTPDSIASISKQTDELSKYKKLHSSILSLQDYLRTNMSSIHEYHSDECDIAFRGKWHDDSKIEIQAFALSDNRGHNAWYINIISTQV